MPTGRAAIAIVAAPAVRVPVPSTVAPSRTVTLPDGAPAPGATGDTVAVTLMPWPVTVGVEATATEVGDGTTTWVAEPADTT